MIVLLLSAPGAAAQLSGDQLESDLFENHGAIKLIIDPVDGEIIAANQAARDFYRFPDLLEMTIGEINQLTEAEVRAEMRRALLEERNYFVFRHATQEKGIRDVEVYSYPMEIDGDGYLYSIVFDITDSLAAERAAQAYRNTLIFLGSALLVFLIGWSRVKLGTTRKSLRETEAVYRSYVNDAPLGVFTADSSGRFLEVNPETCRITGYSRTELEAMSVTTLVDPAHQGLAAAQLQNVLKEGRASGETLFRTRAGEKRWCRVAATGISGKRFLGFVEDITDRKEAEDNLDHERLRLAGIIEGTHAGTWEWNVQTGETVFNDHWAEIIGYTLQEISPVSINTWIEFSHPDDLVWSNALLEELFRGDRDYYEAECRMRHKNGSWVWVLDRGKVVSWTEEGKPLMVMGTHVDITDRISAEEVQRLLSDAAVQLQSFDMSTVDYRQIASVAKRLSGALYADLRISDPGGESTPAETDRTVRYQIRRNEETLGEMLFHFDPAALPRNQDQLEMYIDMVGITLARIRTEEQNHRLVLEKETLLREVHHRIKNNMNTLTSLLSLQAHRTKDSHVASAILEDVQSRFRSMEVLYDRLYRSDIVDSGSLHGYLETLVYEVVALFPTGERVSVTVREDAGETGSCRLDVKRLSTAGLIVNELVTNAMKYAFRDTDSGTLTVTIRCEGGIVEISLRDNGPGLSRSPDAPHATGFGMTMIDAMVEQLGGTVRYESGTTPETKGTTVVVRFPAE